MFSAFQKNQAPTPPVGFYTVFYDTGNGNALTVKDSNCVFTVIPYGSGDSTKIDDCLCEFIDKIADDYGCSLKKGIITASEFESWFENLNVNSVVTIDPYTGSTSHHISSKPQLFVQLTVTNVLCNGDSDGTANAIVSGGTAPYTLDWGGADPGALAAGSYVLTVNDANNVTKVITFVVTEPDALQLTVNVQNTTGGMDNGVASAVVSGGTTPYSYEWRDNLGTPIGQTTQTATGLAIGTYQVVVTDGNGCVIEDLNVVIA